jgi:NAD(P)-dependent dehydrogenase (short-subunit alcohol dehydrogenase family)
LVNETNEADGSFTRRRILVTGAASGIGREVCRQLLDRGAKLGALDIDAAALAREWGNAAVTAAVNVGDPQDVDRAVARVASALDGIDAVVNSAGIIAMLPIAQTPIELWDRLLRVNLTGTHLVCMAALPWLREGRSPAIVNLASGAGLQPMPGLGAYGASKAAVIAYTRYLAQELAPHIRVNAVCPGAIETPMVTSAVPSAAARETLSQAYALRRLGQPGEIAAAVRFLLSAEASYITGAALAADGGRTFH